MTYETSLSIDEKVASLFQPDPVLPAQYFETFRSKTHLEPEKRLMFAVLEDGITCFQKYARAQNSKGKRLFREAEDWILEEGSDWLFSFESICAVWGLDPNYMRHGLIQGKEKLLTQSLKANHRLTHETTKKTCKKRKCRLAA
jgi:hypothetical protein